MNISSFNVGQTRALSNISASSSAVSQALKDASASGRDSTAISGPAQLFSKLTELQKSDPTKLKQVLGKISQTLSDEAASATDPQGQKMLSELASKFQSASESGDLSSVAPPHVAPPQSGGANAAGGRGSRSAGGPPPGGPPPGGAPPGGAPPGGAARGGSASKSGSSSESSRGQSTTSSAELDPADTNKDGTVSAAEKLAYAVSQAVDADSDKAASAYSKVRDAQSDPMKATMSRLLSLVDDA